MVGGWHVICFRHNCDCDNDKPNSDSILRVRGVLRADERRSWFDSERSASARRCDSRRAALDAVRNAIEHRGCARDAHSARPHGAKV